MSSPSNDERPRLSDDEIDLLAIKLKRGAYLEDYYRQHLFREAKEVELGYAAKRSRSEILSSTMAVPLQPLKRYGKAPDGAWTNKLVVGDNLQVLKTLLEMKNRGELKNADGSNGVRLCYIDPPFATRRDFRGARGQRAYRDRVAGAEFVEFLRKRLMFIYELLAEDGTLYLHLDTRKVHYMKVALDEIFGESNFRSEIIWKRTSGRKGVRQYGRVHDVILMYTKSGLSVWNPPAIPQDAATVRGHDILVDDDAVYRLSDLSGAGSGPARQFGARGEIAPPAGRHWGYDQAGIDALMAAGRIAFSRTGSPRLKTPLDELSGVAVTDVWTDVEPINAAAGERVQYPTQKPVALLERIIASSSNAGDLVLDCFSGSGTTAAVAEAAGRRWVAVDSGKLATYITQRRLLEGSSEPEHESLQPFDLCAAGLYDNTLLEGLDFEKYKRFCLDLFECRQEQFKIGGITFAGRRKGEPVHLFPFNVAPDLQMGVDYLESLHERLKGKVSDAVFVIVPITHCDPGLFADVFPIGRILFFVLRVPYSAIEALHGRPFKMLDQPFSEADLNHPVDTFGFDFVQFPAVATSYVVTDERLHVVVKSFKRGGLDPDDFEALDDKGRLDLAMVMVDRSYDSDVFRVSDYFFGDKLEDDGWMFSLPLEGAGKHFFFVFMDTHGNESRERVEIATVRRGAKPRVRKPKVKTARTAEDPVDEDVQEIAAGG